MNVKKFKTLAVGLSFSFVTVGAVLLSTREFSSASAITKWTERTNAKQLCIDYAKAVVDNPDADYVTSTDGHFQVGIRHGNISEGKIQKFDTVTGNGTDSGSFKNSTDTTGAEYVQWNIQTAKNDGCIAFFTAVEELNFSASASNLGGAPYDAYMNYYVQRSGETTYTQIQSNKLVKNKYPEGVALEKTHLNAGDTIWWEFIYSGTDWKRNIQSSFPIFDFEEIVNIPSETLTGAQYVKNVKDSGTGVASNDLVSYTVKAGSILDNEYASLPAGDLGSAGSDYQLTENNITLKNGKAVTFEITAKEDTLVDIMLPATSDPSLTDLLVSGYVFDSKTNKTKRIFDVLSTTILDTDIPSGKLPLKTNSKLYFEYAAKIDGNHNIPSLPSFVLSQLIENERYDDFPKYYSHDLSNETVMTHRNILLESARNRNSILETKELNYHLLTGALTMSKKTLTPYEFIHYDDGQYVHEDPVPEKASMYQKVDEFNAAYGAAVEDYRLSWSDENFIVYEMTATQNTQLVVSHATTNEGWINGTKMYVATYQSVNGKLFETSKKYLTTKENEADSLGATFNLKKNDIAYYVFGSEGAHNGNLSIEPCFTSTASAYDEEARNNQFLNFNENNVQLHDVVTDTIRNSYGEVAYGLLTVALGHGSPENFEQFNNHTGLGDGGADDSVINGAASKNLAQFQRWQMRCGQNDDAIVAIQATRDTHLTITWRKEGVISSWATHTVLKSYAIDTDGFMMFLENKQVSSEEHESIDDTFYNYDVQLKAGQGFMIDYTSLGGSYGVIQYDFVIAAKASEYDETKVFDFTAAKEIVEYKNNKIAELAAYIATLNEDDYSLLNWAYIEEAFNMFVEDIKDTLDKSVIDAAYEKALNTIKSIKTISEEEEAIKDLRAKVKKEARDYLDANKSKMTDANVTKAEGLYTTLCNEVDELTSETSINVKLVRFKASIDAFVKEGKPSKGGCGGTVLATSGIIFVSASIALAVALILKNKKKEQ